MIRAATLKNMLSFAELSEMTIDPKYAGLPGIATNQPDTYETVNSGEEEDSGTDTEETEPTVLHLSSLGWGGQDYQVGPEPGAKAIN